MRSYVAVLVTAMLLALSALGSGAFAADATPTGANMVGNVNQPSGPTAPPTPGGNAYNGGANSNKLNSNQQYLQELNKICGASMIQKMQDTQNFRVLQVFVGCFENILEEVVNPSIQGFATALSHAVSVAMLLYVIFFGIQISTGMMEAPKARGEVIVRLIKIGVISWLVFQLGLRDLFRMTMDVYEEGMNIVIAPAEMETCPGGFIDLRSIWETMDCLYAHILGFNSQNGFGGSWQGIATLFTYITSKTMEGAGGLLSLAFIFNSLTTLFTAFIQIAAAYILSVLGLILLFSIGPLMLPCMLFPQTNQYFEQWWKMIVSFVLQMVIVFAFVTFMFAVLDQMISGPDGLKNLYKNLKVETQVTRADTFGQAEYFWQRTVSYFNDVQAGKGDINVFINMVSILVIGYLLISFIEIIGDLAVELSGASIFPNLMRNNIKEALTMLQRR